MNVETCADYAADMLEYDKVQRDEAILGFTTRYDKLSVTSAIQAHQQGQGDERLFALYLLGCLGTPEAIDHLLVVLRKGDEAEERASAICLANHQVPESVPALIEFLAGPRGMQLTAENWRAWLDVSFTMSQGYIPVLLGRLGDTRAVPALREALARMSRVIDPVVMELHQRGISLELGPEDEYSEDHAILADVHLLELYQDSIVYALGQLGALGALWGFAFETDEQRLWIVHLLMGHLQNRYPLVKILTWSELPDLRSELDALLERAFGLPLEIRQRCLDLYARRYLGQIALHSDAERLAQERGIYC